MTLEKITIIQNLVFS